LRFREDLILSADSSDPFVCADARKLEDHERGQVTFFTAVVTRTDVVYVVATGTSFATPLACKLDVGLKHIRLVAVSPSLRQVLVVNGDSQSAIVSVATFLNFVVPQSVDDLRATDSSPLSLLGLDGARWPSPAQKVMQLAASPRVLEAFWWEPSPESSYILFVEAGGVHVVDIVRPETTPKKISISDVVRSAFRVRRSQTESVMAVFTPALTVWLNLQFVGGEVVIRAATPWSHQVAEAAQFPLCRSEWLLSILAGGSVTFLQSDFRVARTVDLGKAKMFAVTNHFLWGLDPRGSLTAQFHIRNESCEVASDCIGLTVLDAGADRIVIVQPTRVSVVSAVASPVDLFERLIYKGQNERMNFLADGLALDLPRLFSAPIHHHIEHRELRDALRIIEGAPVNFRDALQRVLQEGCHRLALHIALRCPGFENALPHIERTVYAKYSIFEGFSSQFRKIFRRKEFLEYPVPPSPALRFRNTMRTEVEVTDLAVLRNASKLDFPQANIPSLS
jgi:hypothetical protein